MAAGHGHAAGPDQECFGKEAWVIRDDYAAAATGKNACIEDADTAVVAPGDTQVLRRFFRTV
ncbi:hypothetical protein [Methanofollis ethanolicus]|uniref:hypothetical protein n=1 Tax=Methanofollis ethanolicus TaxID=488124 RepID=UPI00082ADCA0|nr:hypothetical protein [Methanofollis ethanolicus]